MSLSSSSLFFVIFTLFVTFICAQNETDSDTMSKSVDFLSTYRESIKYWDTDNLEIRQTILSELAVVEDSKLPGCPRIRFPLICDNDKVLLENSCYFRMRRQERPGLLPVMVFVRTPIETALQKCQKGL